MGIDEAVIRLRSENEALSRGLAQSESMISRWAGRVTTLLGSVGGLLLIHKITTWGKAFVNSAAEAEVSIKRLESTLQSAGNRTGLTIDEMEKLGNEIQRTTKFTADATREVNNFMVRARNIQGDIFREAVKSSADLAEAMGASIPQAGRLLSRALEDPRRGMLSLRAANVQFTASERAKITALTESGQVADAQRLILEKLNTTIGGQAAAATETFSGKMTQFRNRMDDVGKSIGNSALPAIESLMPILERLAKIFELVAVPIGKLVTWVADITAGFLDWLIPMDRIEQSISRFLEIVEETTNFLKEYLSPVVTFASLVIQDLAAAVKDTGQAIVEGMQPYVSSIVESLQHWASIIWDKLRPALIWLAEGGLLAFTALQTGIQNFSDTTIMSLELFALSAVRSFNIVIHFITKAIPEYLSWFLRNWKAIFKDAWEFLKTVVSNMWDNMKNFWDGIMGLFRGEGFNFQFKNLLEGFEATAEALPEIAERVKGDIEKALESDIGERAGRVATAFTKNLENNRKMIADLFKDTREASKKISKDELDAQKERDRAKMLEDDTAEESSKQVDDKSRQGTIEDLMALNRRISQAAAGIGEEEDKAAAAIKEYELRQLDAEAKTHDLLEAQDGHLEDIASKMGRLVNEAPLAGSLLDR